MFAYPIGVIGVAFDVKPPFSLAWAASALLFLEGTLLVLAASLIYGWQKAFIAGLLVMLVSYLAEVLGVATGLPFGRYYYTEILFPRLPGNVPLAVMFAWVLIIFGTYGLLSSLIGRLRGERIAPIGLWGAFVGALLAATVDLAIEPVSFRLEHYWVWTAPGSLNYYGIPLSNSFGWFIIALPLLWLLDNILFTPQIGKRLMPADLRIGRLALGIPLILYGGTCLMFGLVDLTHGYYWGTAWAILAVLPPLAYMRWNVSRRVRSQ